MSADNKESAIQSVASMNDSQYEFFYATSSPFSQWHRCRFTDGAGITYTSAEQYMMYRKAKLFGDITTAGKILATHNQKEIKALGREVAGYSESDWAREREQIVITGNLLKFGQNRGLYNQLKATYPKHLVEASPHDRIWGIGLDETIARNTIPALWRGTNLLGKCLDSVRASLMLQERMSAEPVASVLSAP